MSGINYLLRNFGSESRQTDVEAGGDGKAAVAATQIHFRVDRGTLWEPEFLLSDDMFERADVAGRPAQGE